MLTRPLDSACGLARCGTALLLALLLMLMTVYSASAAARDLTFWKGRPHAWKRSGKCVLGVWGRVTEETYYDHLVVRAGVVAPRSCEPVEIKVEASFSRGRKTIPLDAKEGGENMRLGRWKVVPLTGPQDLGRASVQAELDLRDVPGRLRFGDIVHVRVTARCKHGTTVESDAWYWYR